MHFLHNTISKYKPTGIYSLDVIISVGYRVKSQHGTQFRIWANKILKEYLVKGYAVNEHMRIEHYEDLKKLVQVLERTVQKQDSLTSDETSGLFSVISDYTHALDILDKYDYQKLEINSFSKTEKFHATYENAMAAIEKLRNKFGGSALFANEKDD